MKARSVIVPLSVLSSAAMALSWFFLPDRLPLHWNYAGQVDSWGGRNNILWMAALPLGMAILLRLLPRIDPLRDSHRRHAEVWESLSLVLCLGLSALGWVTVAAGLGLPVETSTLVRLVIGLLLAGLGNSLGKLRRNWFFGIKTPWTLASEESWRLTHRKGGFVFVGLGLLYLASALVPSGPALNLILGIVTGLSMLSLVAYSWWVWRREAREPSDPRS